MALPLPDKPSIAVLPFTNMSADPEQGYFSDGITDFFKASGLFVIARQLTFKYKGRPVRQTSAPLSQSSAASTVSTFSPGSGGGLRIMMTGSDSSRAAMILG